MSKYAAPIVVTLKDKHYVALRRPEGSSVPKSWLRDSGTTSTNSFVIDLTGAGKKGFSCSFRSPSVHSLRTCSASSVISHRNLLVVWFLVSHRRHLRFTVSTILRCRFFASALAQVLRSGHVLLGSAKAKVRTMVLVVALSRCHATPFPVKLQSKEPLALQVLDRGPLWPIFGNPQFSKKAVPPRKSKGVWFRNSLILGTLLGGVLRCLGSGNVP